MPPGRSSSATPEKPETGSACFPVLGEGAIPLATPVLQTTLLNANLQVALN